MSYLKTKRVQLGDNVTASNNFVLRQPDTADGTMRISNGIVGAETDLVTVTSAGNVGVGTSSPKWDLGFAGYAGSLLDINSTTTNEPSVLALTSTGTNTTARGIISFQNLSQTAGSARMAQIQAERTNASTTALDADLAFLTSQAGTLAERMRIDSTGAVTMPYQPAFLAMPDGGVPQNNIPVNTNTTVVLGSVKYDQNSDFASNTFTAPVGGKYQLNTHIRLQDWDVGAIYYQFAIVTSNRVYYTSWDAKISSVDLIFITLSLSVLADMDAGDTAYLRMQQSSGTSQTDIHGETTFSGYLVC